MSTISSSFTARYRSACPVCNHDVLPGTMVVMASGWAIHLGGCADKVRSGQVALQQKPAREAKPSTRAPSRRTSGFAPVRGCAACRSAGRMCKQCQFDEYDC